MPSAWRKVNCDAEVKLDGSRHAYDETAAPMSAERAGPSGTKSGNSVPLPVAPAPIWTARSQCPRSWRWLPAMRDTEPVFRPFHTRLEGHPQSCRITIPALRGNLPTFRMRAAQYSLFRVCRPASVHLRSADSPEPTNQRALTLEESQQRDE